MRIRIISPGLLLAMAALPALAADPTLIRYQAPLLALTHVQLVDGTGAAPRSDVTILIEDGRLAAVGPAGDTEVDSDATVIDGRGKTVLPGFVFMHEHMFYPVGELQFGDMLQTFPPLYLAGGVTTARTAGTLSPYADLKLRDGIAAGTIIGPDLDVTGPYIDAAGLPVLKVHGLADVDETEKFVNYWADQGATSFKAYLLLTRNQLKRAIETAHSRNARITGHLCSVTYREAAAMGIDNLEHGFGVMTDFVEDKQPDVCPIEALGTLMNDVDPEAAEVQALIRYLVDREVVLTSTLVPFEDQTPGRPPLDDRARSVLLPQVLKQYDDNHVALAAAADASQAAANLAKIMTLERMFVAAGGTLMAGTDPTGLGGVVPGFASKRQIELLVEAGFTFPEAIRIASLNGARYLGRDDEVGSVEVGKRADLILIDGDPVTEIASIRRMPVVFKGGIGYDTAGLIREAQGLVGLR